MRYAVTLTNEKGKIVTLAGNVYIDIDINVGNQRIAALTLRIGEHPKTGDETIVLYDEHDEALAWYEHK